MIIRIIGLELWLVDSGNTVGYAADEFVGYRFGKTGKFFGAYLFPALLAYQDDLIPYPGAFDMADIDHHLVHRDFADYLGAPAADQTSALFERLRAYPSA